jgi:hypothetical protein
MRSSPARIKVMQKPEDALNRFINPRQSGQPASDSERGLEQFIQTYKQKEQEVADFYEGEGDVSIKLALAVNRGDTEQAERFIAQGGDVNFRRQGRLPLIHEAAGLGHRAIVYALLASGKCDLTVRDSLWRLASDVAGLVAKDYELADRLAEEQAQQFRAKNIDPRRPDHPDYGNWKWED